MILTNYFDFFSPLLPLPTPLSLSLSLKFKMSLGFNKLFVMSKFGNKTLTEVDCCYYFLGISNQN